jgi:hypothetical protein
MRYIRGKINLRMYEFFGSRANLVDLRKRKNDKKFADKKISFIFAV